MPDVIVMPNGSVSESHGAENQEGGNLLGNPPTQPMEHQPAMVAEKHDAEHQEGGNLLGNPPTQPMEHQPAMVAEKHDAEHQEGGNLLGNPPTQPSNTGPVDDTNGTEVEPPGAQYQESGRLLGTGPFSTNNLPPALQPVNSIGSRSQVIQKKRAYSTYMELNKTKRRKEDYERRLQVHISDKTEYGFSLVNVDLYPGDYMAYINAFKFPVTNVIIYRMPYGNNRYIQHFTVKGSLLRKGVRELRIKEEEWKQVWNIDALTVANAFPFYWSVVKENQLLNLILAATKLSTVADDQSQFGGVHCNLERKEYMKQLMGDINFNIQFKSKLNSHGLCDWGTLYREVNTPDAIDASNDEVKLLSDMVGTGETEETRKAKTIPGIGVPSGSDNPNIGEIPTEQCQEVYLRKEVSSAFEMSNNGYSFYRIPETNSIFAKDSSGYWYKLNNETRCFEFRIEGLKDTTGESWKN
ncbi:hypothetical protein CRE_11290 [Caenorhabditis remanei]|uniref:Uncharacterized protein n=1 Tax=Caenorhabditis remanei TaxID=31234 RepID=E3N0D2_CAERE|nr:hypothetical protein CRE_11290 [Caenorhabditis remanei]